MRLETAADALGIGRTPAEKAADLLGRMATVDARHEAVEPLEFAFRGDRPLDWSPDRSASCSRASARDRAALRVGPRRRAPCGRLDACRPAELPDGGSLRAARARRVGDQREHRRRGQGRPPKISRILPDGRAAGSRARSPPGRATRSPPARPTAQDRGLRDPRHDGRRAAMALAPADVGAPPRVLAPGPRPAFAPGRRVRRLQRAHARGLAALRDAPRRPGQAAARRRPARRARPARLARRPLRASTCTTTRDASSSACGPSTAGRTGR